MVAEPKKGTVAEVVSSTLLIFQTVTGSFDTYANPERVYPFGILLPGELDSTLVVVDDDVSPATQGDSRIRLEPKTE